MSINNNKVREEYWTQEEMARRWRVSESTLKNWRDKGTLPFFSLPESSRVLYPVDAILELEKNNIHNKEVENKQTDVDVKRKKPVVSTKSTKEWRI